MSVGWTPTPQHHTHTYTQSPSTSTWPLPWLLSLVSHTAIPTHAKLTWPPQHPPRPPAQAPILQTSQCTHNTQQSGHRSPRDRHSGQSSPGTQQQHPPVQLWAENRVLFRVGGTLGRWGAQTTPTDTTARGERGAGGLCQHGRRCAEPTPGLCQQPRRHKGTAPCVTGTWHRQQCHSGHS